MTDLTHIPLDKIDVEEGFNPRERAEASEELVATVRDHGVLQPVLVEANDGRYRLIAGERRYRAASEAGLKEIPAQVREADGDGLDAALIENLVREDLTPIEEARALRRLADSAALSQKALAERIRKPRAYVRERLRLLELPETVQALCDGERLALVCVPPLVKIAKAIPALTTACAELIARGEIDPGEFARHPGRIAYQVIQHEELPVVVTAQVYRPEALPVTDEVRAELERELDSIDAGDPYYGQPVVEFSDADVDAMRALGVLVEFDPENDWGSSYQFVADGEVIADRAREAVKRTVRAHRKREREAAKAASEPGEAAQRGESGDAKGDAEQRRKDREAKRKREQEARASNQELGRRLIDRRGKVRGKKRLADRAKALALLVVEDNRTLAAAGLRLVHPAWREVETKTLKSGEVREKVRYLEQDEATERLRDAIQRSRSAEEVLDVMFEALVAARFADQDELPQSKRVHSHVGLSEWAYSASPAEVLVDETIDAEAKGVLPSKLPKELEARAKRREKATKQWSQMQRASTSEHDEK